MTKRVGLIAMPTHGYGPFRRFILGSNTAKVLHDADCPVLDRRPSGSAPADSAAAIHRILCALDLGPQAVGANPGLGGLAATGIPGHAHAHPCRLTAHAESLDEPDTTGGPGSARSPRRSSAAAARNRRRGGPSAGGRRTRHVICSAAARSAPDR